ncbi:MAG: hypothetical protein ACYS9Y_05405 [Planctomycetota bacterium]|jgi:hypothetical protein
MTTSANNVVIVDNSWRLEKFRTYTILVDEGGKEVIYKCAATEKSKPFIISIAKKEKLNAEYLKGQFDVLCGLLEKDRIKYDYLTYPSLKDEIISHMRQRRYSSANELFEKYVDKIRSLKRIKTIPKEFLKMFLSKSVAQIPKIDCLTRGLLDLTPDNIMVNGDHWIVLDNEWSFDFPMPIMFIVFRALQTLVVILQPEIRKAASRTNPVIGIFAGRLRTYYIPISWMKYITYYDVSLWRTFQWELGFQQYVTGSTDIRTFRIRKNPWIRTRFLL